jgi:C-terminal processing protease CtpA/Prc
MKGPKKRRIKKKVEFSPADVAGIEGGVTQKTIRIRPDNQKLGVALIWGLQTGLQEAGIYVKTIAKNGVAQRAGLIIGDRIVSVNKSSLISLDYQSAINSIKNAGREFTLNIIRPKMVFILNPG